MIDRAVNEHERRMCPCGCGHWYSETHDDPDGDDEQEPLEWEVVEDICHARAALDEHRASSAKNKPTPGLMLYTRPVVDEVDSEDLGDDDSPGERADEAL